MKNWKQLVIGCAALLSCPLAGQAQVDAQMEGMRHERSDGYVWPKDKAVLQKLEQWQDLKFGVIIHWGLYSVPGIMESWNLCGEDLDWIKRPAHMSYEQYKQWYWGLKDSLNPVKFQPDQWADLMVEGGMKYVVFTTKHHEGFCMFDTKQTDFSIMNGPFGKDPRADIARHVFEAFRKKNFMIGAYFSKPDWHSEYYWWPYLPTPDRNVNYSIRKHPDRWEKFCRFTYNQIEELMSGYGPIDILWLDGGQVAKRWFDQDIHMDRIAAMSRRHQPGLIVVDRTVKGEFENYQTPEGQIPDQQLDVPWETCMGMNGWGWRSEGEYKPLKRIVASLIEVVAKGGNFLLGVGPNGEGVFDEKAVAMIRTIGQWLKQNGEAIYATRTTAHYQDGQVWFTAAKNGKRMYALYALPEGQELVPEVLEWTTHLPKGRKVTLLSTGQRLKCQVKEGRVSVRLPKGVDRTASLALAFDVE